MPDPGKFTVFIINISDIVTGGWVHSLEVIVVLSRPPSHGFISGLNWLVFIVSHISPELCFFQDIYRKPTILLTQTRQDVGKLSIAYGQRLMPIASSYIFDSRRIYLDKIHCGTGALSLGLFRDTKPDNETSYHLDITLLSAEHSIH